MLKYNLFLLLICVASASAALSRTYSNCMIIRTASDWQGKFYWTVSGSTINIGIESNASKGYFSVGITTISGAMNGGGPDFPADGWIISSNDDVASTDTCSAKQTTGGCIGDLYIPSYSVPTWDATQSTSNVKVSKDGNMLYGEFDRLLNTGDSQDRVLFVNNVTFFMWAAHDSAQPRYGSMATHTKYGLFSVTLNDASSCTVTPPSTPAPSGSTGTTPAPPPPTDCAKQYDQCGGQNYNGPTCCESPYNCIASNQYYSQCLNQAAPPSPSTPSPSTPAPTTPTTPGTTPAPSTPGTSPVVDANCEGLYGIVNCPCTPSGYCDSGLTCTSNVCTSSAAAVKINVLLFTIMVLLVIMF